MGAGPGDAGALPRVLGPTRIERSRPLGCFASLAMTGGGVETYSGRRPISSSSVNRGCKRYERSLVVGQSARPEVRSAPNPGDRSSSMVKPSSRRAFGGFGLDVSRRRRIDGRERAGGLSGPDPAEESASRIGRHCERSEATQRSCGLQEGARSARHARPAAFSLEAPDRSDSTRGFTTSGLLPKAVKRHPELTPWRHQELTPPRF
jgi:hypothetical protein